MNIEFIRALRGPNVYTYRPALLMRLDLETLFERESRELAGFNERLCALLPGLGDHHCSKGRPGGFLERLAEGTYFGHIVEHVALELTGLAGVPVFHGKTRYSGEGNIYHVVIEYTAEETTKLLLSSAVELVEALVRGDSFPLAGLLEEARELIRRTELGPSTRAIVEAAARRGIPHSRIGDASLLQLGYGCHRRLVQAAMTDRTSAVGVEIASDKDFTKHLLEQASIPVPRGQVVYTADEAVAALATLGPAVVVKPLDGRQGQGVCLNLRTAEEVRAAFRIAHQFSGRVLIEELLVGRNYRVLVVGGRMVAASERLACHVTGDGTHTVAELVAEVNDDPRRGQGHEKPLTKIHLDEVVIAHLHKSGRRLTDVPAVGEVVTLRESINLSTGGTARDVTDEVHPEVAALCERAARLVGMDICGVDLVLEDISRPVRESRGAVIELNASPGLRMHQWPSEGTARDVGAEIVRMMYPEGETGRIPIISITGTNGKTTVTRMIGQVLSAAGLAVGMTTTDGIYIGGRMIVEGDTTGPHSARAVLSDPTVEVAVLETARGGIMRRGLGYDWSDVGVLTNIQPDHIGQDGIKSVEDLVWVKSLVAERVRDGGTLVLNADDERLVRLVEEERVRAASKRVVYFSLREEHLLIKRHVEAGGTAYYVRDGWVMEACGSERRALLETASVPATMDGTAEYQVSNVLAAVAACRVHGASVEQLVAGLTEFQGARDNPGRTNLYRVASGGHVLLDYGHNPEAFRAVCETAGRWEGMRVTGIVGVPGDRGDELIEEAGRVAARGFERLIIKEDRDLRGRAPGEVSGLLCRAAQAEVPERVCEVVYDEVAALAHELAHLGPRDVVVMFYEKLAPLVELLERHGGQPVSQLEGLRTGVATAPNVTPFKGAARHQTAAPQASIARAGQHAEARMRDEARGCQHYAWR